VTQIRENPVLIEMGASMTCSMGLIDQFFDGSMAHRRVDDMSMNKNTQADDYGLHA